MLALRRIDVQASIYLPQDLYWHICYHALVTDDARNFQTVKRPPNTGITQFHLTMPIPEHYMICRLFLAGTGFGFVHGKNWVRVAYYVLQTFVRT